MTITAVVCSVCNAPMHPMADWCLECTSKGSAIRIREEPTAMPTPLQIELTEAETEALRQALALALGCINSCQQIGMVSAPTSGAARHALLDLNRRLVPAEPREALQELEALAVELGEP